MEKHDNQPRIFALDFDGVLCDSALETAHTAWRAMCKMWNDWPEEPPASCVEQFRRLRPVLETGYQAIPLMRLVVQGIPESNVFDNPDAYIQQAITEIGCSVEDLQNVFASARDQWINNNFEDWIAHHHFYPGTIDALLTAREHDAVYILTTKQERFAIALLEAAGLQMNRDRIYGLESREPKEVILSRILEKDQANSENIRFVEDRLPTLERTLQASGLDQIKLYLADWGYNTEGARRRASQTSGIEILSLERFCSMLRSG